MGRHQHGEAQCLRESIRGARVRELAAGELRLVDEPDRRRAQRSQHQTAQLGAWQSAVSRALYDPSVRLGFWDATTRTYRGARSWARSSW